MNDIKIFYCYSKELATFLRYEKGINYLTKALHHTTLRPMWLFIQCDEIHNAVQEFKEKNKT